MFVTAFRSVLLVSTNDRHTAAIGDGGDANDSG
jgi:hypothetical protein